MDFDSFLRPADAARALRTLRKLAAHAISDWALTGELALELHLIQHHRKPHRKKFSCRLTNLLCYSQ